MPDYNFLSADEVKSPAAFGQDWANLRARVLQNQQMAGEQAAGNALAASTDPQTGVVDYGKAQSLIASNPVAARAMLQTLNSTSNLQNNQLARSKETLNLYGQSAMSVWNDPSDANVNATFDNLRSVMPASQLEAERQRVLGMTPDQRRMYAVQHGMAAMSGMERFTTATGAAGVSNQPQGAVPYVQRPAWQGGGLAPAGGGVAAGASPGQGMELVPTQVRLPDGTYQTVNVPRQYLPGYQPGTPAGGTPANPPGVPAPGSAIPPNPNAPQGTPPGRIRPPPGSPLLPPTKTAGDTTAPAPSTPAQTPSGGAAAPASGSPVVQTPAGPGVVAAPPQGQPESVAADVKNFKTDQSNLPNWQTADQNLAIAHEALKLTSSGTNQDTLNRMYSFLSGMNMLPPGYTNDMKNFEVFRKATERVVANAGNAAGTDAGRALAAASNPGVEYSKPANLEIIRNDIGKNRQQMAAIMLEDQNGTGAGYTGRRAQLASNTDFRGFAWNLYSPAEQQKILAEVGKDPAAEAKLYRAIGMAAKLNINRSPGQTPASG